MTAKVTPELMKQIRGSVTAGLTELIKNALDSDATEVDVAFNLRGDTLDTIVVTDNGSGLTYGEVASHFRPVGQSWKALQQVTLSGRRLFGARGKGRLGAFALGEQATWVGKSSAPGMNVLPGSDPAATDVVSVVWRSSSDEFSVDRLDSGCPAAAAISSESGTQVIVAGPWPAAEKLRTPRALRSVLKPLAEHLWRHPELTVSISGSTFDAGEFQTDVTTVTVGLEEASQLLEGGGYEGPSAAEIVITEWEHNVRPTVNVYTPDGRLQWFDNSRVAATGVGYSAKVTWEGAGLLEEVHLLGNLAEPMAAFNRAVEQRLRQFFVDKADATRAALLSDWREEGSYPYEGEPASESEAVERELFDVVAVTAAPVLKSSDAAGRKFSLQLLRQALQSDSGALRRILEQVLGLSADEVGALDELLTQTSLPAMMAIGKTTADRLTFVAWLEQMLSDSAWVKALTERKGLQDIIERNAWIFGDDWQTVIADRALATGLERLRTQGLPDIGAPRTVRDEAGRVVRVDLLLSRAKEALGRRQHLVVELKRPSERLKKEHLDQLEGYVSTIMNDAQFNDGKIDWRFLLVGRECDSYVDRKRSSIDRPHGLVDSQKLDNGATYTLEVRMWSEVVQEAKARLRFLSDHLSDFPDQEDIDRLGQAHSELGMGPRSSAEDEGLAS